MNRNPPKTGSVQGEFARAVALRWQGQSAEAEEICRVILKSQQRHFDAAYLLGVILLERGDAQEAEKRLARALKFAPEATDRHALAEAFKTHGLALEKLERFEDATASYARGLVLEPDSAPLLNHYGSALHEAGKFEEALAAADRLVAVAPQSAAVHFNRAKTLYSLRRIEESTASFDRAIALKPDFHNAYRSRSYNQFLLGNLAQGWEDGEYRRYLNDPDDRKGSVFAASATREMLKGKHVLVVAEQGVGDEILLAGMIGDLLGDARSVTLECDARLLGLFSRSFPALRLVARKTPPDWDAVTFDHVMAAQSLGRLYRGRLENFPDREYYLIPSQDIVAAWKRRIAALQPGPAIGISWKGGSARASRATRSIPLDQWAPIFAIQGAHFVNLQYGQVKEEIARASRSLPRPITYFEPAEIDDFDQLAGLVCALDFIVSIDTALVHLCGAIGKACKVLVPYIPDWRYGLSGDRMPFYRSPELYRQDRPGEWKPAIGQAAADLKAAISRHTAST